MSRGARFPPRAVFPVPLSSSFHYPLRPADSREYAERRRSTTRAVCARMSTYKHVARANFFFLSSRNDSPGCCAFSRERRSESTRVASLTRGEVDSHVGRTLARSPCRILMRDNRYRFLRSAPRVYIFSGGIYTRAAGKEAEDELTVVVSGNNDVRKVSSQARNTYVARTKNCLDDQKTTTFQNDLLDLNRRRNPAIG